MGQATSGFAAVPRRFGVFATLSLVAVSLNLRAQPSPPPAPAATTASQPPPVSSPPPPPAASPPPLRASPLSPESAPPPPGAPPPSDGSSCFPACREGFVCSRSTCVSLCNPPCPAEQVCIGGRRCDYAPPPGAGGVAEPPPPKPVTFAERNFQMAAFHYAFPTDVDLNGEKGFHGPAYGVNLRSDVPVVPYIVLGPMLEFASYDPGYYFDLDLCIRPRLAIDAKSVQFQLWAGVPIGLTLSFLHERYSREFDSFALGWNLGVLGGGAIHLSRDFGLFTEFGWQQQKMTHDRVNGNTAHFRFAPVVWNIGFVFRG